MRPLLLRVFEESVAGPDDLEYAALICGRLLEDGRWEAWIEFVPEQGGPLIRSRRETTQSNQRVLEGWASRLTRVYLEGALQRALDLEHPRARPVPREPARPHFEGPAPPRGAEASIPPDDAAVNPFLLYGKGEAALSSALGRLSAADLRTVIWAYGLESGEADPRALSRPQLIELVVRAVRRRMERW